MNSEINKKTPAFIYAKEFKLAKVLGNLQAYKLATGDVGQAEINEASEKHGNNLGAVYGSLITKAALNKDTNKRKGNGGETSSVRRQKRKRDKTLTDSDVAVNLNNCEKNVNYSTTLETDEPLPLPKCLLKEEKPESCGNRSSSCSDSDDEIVDFFGLSESVSSEKGTQSYCFTQNQQNKEILSSKRILSEKTKPIKHEDTSELCTYRCWKCKRRGHLAEHCTILDINRQPPSYSQKASGESGNHTDLQELFARCKRFRKSKTLNCNECGNCSNLAHCFECGLTLCDGQGHLIDHLLNFPTHTKIYSHKLQRLLKCSNSSCTNINVTELLTCPQCLSKIFDKHYSLVNATWSARGLKEITNAICCEKHYHWHRMNCYNSYEEILFNQEKMEKLKREHNGLLSEFFF